MATSPSPDAAAPPGMCPGIAVLGGGGAGGDGNGNGNGGKDGAGGDGNGDGKTGSGDGKNADGAPDYAKYPECGYASHPVDVVTGRAFAHPITDLELPGPLPLTFARMYSSKMAGRDVGLGFGWGHTFGWQIEITRFETVVWNEQGIAVRFPKLEIGQEHIGPWAWLLRRSADGYWLDADDGVFRVFELADERTRTYRLVRVEDRNHNRITLRYDGRRLAEIEDSVGRIVRVRSTREGRIALIEVKNAIAQGQWVAFGTYAYDDHGNLVSAMDADGFAATYAYDEDHRLTADTDRTGLCFHFVYDAEGRCVESWGDYPGRRDPSLADGLPKKLADGVTRAKGIHHCRFDYRPDRYSEVADSTQVRRFFGTKHGTLEKSVEGGGVTTATYRDDGHILSRTDPLGATTIFDRDARGHLVAVTDALAQVTRIERDGNGLAVRIVDAAGGVTRIERDARGNVLLVTDAMGSVTAWRYDARGLPVERVSPTGGRTTYAYDAHANLERLVLPNGGVLRYAWDGLGRLLAKTDPLGAETRYAYSNRGDLIATRDALGQMTRYADDGEGHLVRIEDPAGQATELTWGGYHKLCARKDANGNVVRLQYNLEGELTHVWNERGEAHRLEYTTSGRLREERTFDGRVLRYRSDLAGHVIRIENGAREITAMEYDLLGRLAKRELYDGSEESFAYDPLSNLIEAKNPAGRFRFERDLLGRVVREAQTTGGEEHWTEVRYDADGQRIGRATSLGHAEAVKRGLLGERRETLLDGDHLVRHDADLLGRETARALPRGGWLQSQYDALGRVARRRAGATVSEPWAGAGQPEWIGARPDGVGVDTVYRYDPAGELVESIDKSRGRTTYAYDRIGQLLAMVPERARAELFKYDPAGNLSEADAGASDRVYGTGNRLLRKGDTEYVWDDDGRLAAKRTRTPAGVEEVWRYRWDAAGLLKRVERPDGLMAEFAYDPFARRMSKRVTKPARGDDAASEVTTKFVWDGDVLVHDLVVRAEGLGDPVVEARTYCFEDGSFAPVAHREAGGWFHYVNDPIGTPERLIATDGLVAREGFNSVWGQPTKNYPSFASTQIRFQGQYDDVESGLFYNRFRYYDPDTGIFQSADPIGLHGGLSSWAYGRNTTRFIDPLGLAGRAWFNYAKAYHDKMADSVYGPGSGRTVVDADGNVRHYDKQDGELDVEFKATNFTKTANAEASARECRQIAKDKANKEAELANPHWHFLNDPTTTDRGKAITKKLDDAGIPWSHGPTKPKMPPT